MKALRVLATRIDHVVAVLIALVTFGATTGVACANSVEAPAPSRPQTAPPTTSASAASASIATRCMKDEDCGFDPAGDRCGSDPRFNRQPPLVDQGVICFCDESARVCEELRVWPIPCESDASCAVSLEPRAHPVAATASHPHEHGKACTDFHFATTCERTNICTMHRLACADGPKR